MIPFANRDYRGIDNMDRALIKLWNVQVKPDDRVFFLGDFATHGRHPVQLEAVFEQLNGEKHLIVGNHDDHAVQRLGWASVQASMMRHPEEAPELRFHMSHYPPPPSRRNDGELYLHGHLHTMGPPTFPSYDVGVDANMMAPVPESRIVQAAQAYLRRRASGLEKLRRMK